MKLIDWLRRLGIFRSGSETAVYRNAKERPASFMMEGVFDSKKDVVDLNREPSANPPTVDTEKK